MLPELVNFKTGGVLMSIASASVVKGDMNGHIGGTRSKLNLTFPVSFAVYLPEGVEINAHQLLRPHPSSNSRELGSVTGGVMLVSGGATRDAVEFQPIKIGPRIYQVDMQLAMAKGEHGLLPPGAVGPQTWPAPGRSTPSA